jgi:histidinol-phosphate phosphatase family protein
MAKKTLFLDRDGVINLRVVGDYVRSAEQFEFLPGTLEALERLSKRFDYIFVITNQQGIGKGVFTLSDLELIHNYFIEKVQQNGGRIDKIYFCPDLEKDNSNNRKPNPGMGLQALHDYPDINLSSAIMVGDSLSDMQFGNNLGVKTVFLTNGEPLNKQVNQLADQVFTDLSDFAFHSSLV